MVELIINQEKTQMMTRQVSKGRRENAPCACNKKRKRTTNSEIGEKWLIACKIAREMQSVFNIIAPDQTGRPGQPGHQSKVSFF